MTQTSPLSYTLVISGAPYSSQAPQTALAFAKAATAAGHKLDRVFLYGDGVYLASSLVTAPSDEVNWTETWCDFLCDTRTPATVCIASALRRGILNESEKKRYQRTASNLADPFEIAGLGDWVESVATSSRVLYFLPAE
ncbi:sulfurtransferase complex subunit TusD [Marinobacter caseinilyticus]|uniref:sulfurtransferase complex subunit TusD n=1 Tax=Marinobacter caseinilyticus TaxID=2692195 RepID=UPI001409D8A5|nr:sulfurtransferase complex subunit TusD [Marinobacter caseinilyticus]